VVGRRLAAVDGVLERALEDVDDLLARVLMPDDRRLEADLDAVLDDLAAGDAEVAVLKVGAPEPRRLLNGGGHFEPPWSRGCRARASPDGSAVASVGVPGVIAPRPVPGPGHPTEAIERPAREPPSNRNRKERSDDLHLHINRDPDAGQPRRGGT